MNLTAKLTQRVDGLLAQRARMTANVRTAYQAGRWATASPAERARTRTNFRIINTQLRRALAEQATYASKTAAEQEG
jgi:hypothetical protein